MHRERRKRKKNVCANNGKLCLQSPPWVAQTSRMDILKYEHLCVPEIFLRVQIFSIKMINVVTFISSNEFFIKKQIWYLLLIIHFDKICSHNIFSQTGHQNFVRANTLALLSRNLERIKPLMAT